MSTTLKDMMHARADATPDPNLDVAAAIRRGRRRVWRNRAAGVVVCAAAIALAMTAPMVLSGPGGSGDDTAGGIGARLAATYATGSAIHHGDQTIDVAPLNVRSFLQTDDGFVFTTPDHDVYFTDGGAPEQIGTGDLTGTLEADDTGGYVAWVDNQAQPLPEFVVYDTGTQSEVARTSEGIEPGMGTTVHADSPYVLAVDGDTAYWHDARGFVAWNLTTERGRVVLAGASRSYLKDVADGRLLRYDDGRDFTGERDLVVSTDPTATQPRFAGLGGSLSPNAAYLASQTIAKDYPYSRLIVSDVASGADVTPATTGYHAVLVTQWLGDEEYAAAGIANDGSGSVDLLSCSIPRGSCDVAAADIGTVGDVRLPLGQASMFD